MLETLADEVERRGGCRYGLQGVRMRHLPTGREFECGGSEWGPGDGLSIYTRAEGMKPGHEKEAPDAIVMYTLGELTEGIDPLKPDEIVKAEDCVLLDPWPVVCCKPKRRRRSNA